MIWSNALSEVPSVAAVIFVSNVQRIRDFYRTVIRMDLAEDQPNYAILTIPGFELVIHGIPGESDSSFASNEIPEVREECNLKLCLPVASIREARARALALGGSIQAEEFEWSARGVKACDGYDPEGNVFQVRAVPK
jgi:predicted enzyme related to lactoylglutathione lyase